MFASRHTLGDKRGTLGCWSDVPLVEAEEKDLDAVEAHLGKRLEVKVLARIGGKSSGEAGLLKRVLRYDAATESFLWCSAKRYVQDAAAALQLVEQSHKCKMGDTLGTNGTGATQRDGDHKLDENETAAFWIALGSVIFTTQIAIDGSLREVGRMYSVCGWAAVQMNHDGGLEPWCGVGGNMPVSLEVQRTIKWRSGRSLCPCRS